MGSKILPGFKLILIFVQSYWRVQTYVKISNSLKLYVNKTEKIIIPIKAMHIT